MKLNFSERLLVNNPVRALVQRFYEGPLLLRLGGRLDDAQVLEIGCGCGVGLQILLEQFRARHICGIDVDPQQVRRARRRLNKKHDQCISLAVANVISLPFANEYFDAVIDFGVLHHVVGWQSGLAEIRRVLKPGGRFFFEEVTRAALKRWIYRRFLEHPAENRFSEAEFIAELLRHGIDLSERPKRILADDIFIGVGERLLRQQAQAPGR